MKSEDFLNLLNNINEKYIENATEKLEYYRQIQAKGIVYVKQDRKFAWREVLTSVICTSAVIFGVFSVVLNLFENTHKPNDSGVSIGASSENSNPLIKDKYGLIFDANFSGEISVNAAYSFENDIIKRYEVGDKFGDFCEISKAKSTFDVTKGNAILKEQQISLNTDFICSVEVLEDFAAVNLPNFGDDFTYNVELADTISDPQGEGENLYAETSAVSITVKYDQKTVTVTYDSKAAESDVDIGDWIQFKPIPRS